MPSLRLKRARHMPGAAAIAAAVLLLIACSSTPASPVHSPSPFTGGMTEGLIAYVADQGVGVLDPTTGKSVIVAPLPPGTFRVHGPGWAPAPRVNHPELYFTVHAVLPARTRTGADVAPYDCLVRRDHFDGPVVISADGTMAAVAMPDRGAVIQPINSALPLASPSAGVTPAGTASPRPSPTLSAPKRVNSKLQHPDGLAWSPDAKQLAIAVGGEIQLYSTSGADGTAPAKRYLTGANVLGVAWSAPIEDMTFATAKAGAGPLAMVDALLNATRLPAQADTPANRPLTKVYVWLFDSTKTSPIESITDATPSVLAKFPPLNAGVVFHHWAATDTWGLLGGCYRYRVVVTGSVSATACTFGLGSNELWSARPSATTTSSPTT